MDDTPASLLQRLRSPHEEKAWARFVDLYTPLLYHWARQVGLRQEDASDLVQDVFVLLLRKLPEFTYDGNRSFRAWLRTVTLNKWRERCRQAGMVAAGLAAAEELPASEEEALWEREYRDHLIGRALEIMRTDFQPATWRACWEVVVAGRPAAEVAAELGLSVGAVHAARFRVLARLRQELDGLMD